MAPRQSIGCPNQWLNIQLKTAEGWLCTYEPSVGLASYSKAGILDATLERHLQKPSHSHSSVHRILRPLQLSWAHQSSSSMALLHPGTKAYYPTVRNEVSAWFRFHDVSLSALPLDIGLPIDLKWFMRGPDGPYWPFESLHFHLTLCIQHTTTSLWQVSCMGT